VPVDAEPLRLPALKRASDVVLAGALLAAAVPAAAIAAGAMAADMLVCRRDRGRFLYRERRVSRGREFDLLKLRTVRKDALARMEEPGGHARVLEADPSNLTWAGRRVLKPWYLDELPQLVNVLRGEMSLVGPRPWPPSLVARQVARGLDYRLRVPAGWTGPAQVSKGTDASFEQLDLDYVERCESATALEILRVDLGILRRTVRTLLRGEGLRY
jgi:lipopolysaccharide/colanic/teichoic acid biosynthesis glycosyltransferase